jgi:hypothetical protein
MALDKSFTPRPVRDRKVEATGFARELTCLLQRRFLALCDQILG